MFSLIFLISNPELIGVYLLNQPVSVECWHQFLRAGIALKL